MRKNPFSDHDDPAVPPMDADATAPEAPASADPAPSADAAAPADDNTAPSLVWPPLEDELNDWEVLHVQSTGQTFIEPMNAAPPASAGAPPTERPSFPAPPTPAPYVPPAPLEDPAGETSLLSSSTDIHLPQTELIEPWIAHPMPGHSGGHAAAKGPAAPDDRTVVIQRPAGLTPKPEAPAATPPPAGAHRQPTHDDTNHATATRILVAPAFAASVGHALTVPVSAAHRAPRPQPAFGPRPPMEDTLPAGVTREFFSADYSGASEDTFVPSDAYGDTHPVPVPAARRAGGASAGPPSPFSRASSRSAQPLSTESAPEPAPILLAPPPLAFGPRVPSSTSSSGGPSMAGTATAPIVFPVPAPAGDASIPTRPAPISSRRTLLSVFGVLVVLLLLALGAYQVMSMRSTAAGAPAMATLSIESSPAGATVTIDGTTRGTTPLRLELGEGSHALDVSLAGATRHVPLSLAGGTITAHSFEFAPAAAPTVADAAIEIRSEPAGGRVQVDGVPRGVTPIVVTGLTAGRHEVQVGGPFRTVTRTVTVAAGQQALLVVTPARTPAPPAGDERPARASADTGYISIQSPIPLRVVRNGDFVGTSEDSRLSLPIGNQVIGLENESVGFRDVRTVEVIAGKVTPVPVSLPKGEISINARPWAEVFVDGNRAGETPVSQLSLPVGVHEVVFRHPELGERSVSVLVKIGATARAFTDFTK
jgi:hypothetical protein